MRELQLLNENRRQLEQPSGENEQENEAYQQKMQLLMNTKDDMEARESKFAKIQSEQQVLTAELESLQDRKKNMQLIND